MNLLHRYVLLTVPSENSDALDVQPRGDGCMEWAAPGHEFFIEFHAAGLTYKVCGRCGTVRIKERHQV